MTPEILTALKASIQHWHDNEALVLRGKRPDTSAKSCALCGLFSKQCDGCPVCEKNGCFACEGTPYQRVSNLKFTWDGKDPRMLKAVREEIKFLESLLPEGEQV